MIAKLLTPKDPHAAYLFAPEAYWHMTPEERARVTNGCGAKGLGGWLVPDTLYGLPITVACSIHDYMYDVGVTIDDKDSADRAFLNNMIRIIAVVDGWRAITILRQRRALTYYQAVSQFGGPAFWANKEPRNMAAVSI